MAAPCCGDACRLVKVERKNEGEYLCNQLFSVLYFLMNLDYSAEICFPFEIKK